MPAYKSVRFRSVLFLFALCSLNVASSNQLDVTETTAPSDTQKCLYISSYHRGHEWSDGIEASIRETLHGHCELRQVDMDTKRKQSPEEIFAAVNRAVKVIEDWQPDVVITSDDNAAKHIITPLYRDADLPFIFSGVNWTVEEYGFPYVNVTGIVEVSPYKTMLTETAAVANHGVNNALQALYIGANTLSEKKNFVRLQAEAEELNIQIEASLASHFQHWKKALATADKYDFIVIGSNAGIEDWEDQRAIQATLSLTTKISVTAHKWMMPYATLGFTTLPGEQGTWAANAAIKVLQGTKPADIPLASNKKWDIWINEKLLYLTDVQLNRHLMRKAKRTKSETGIITATNND